MALSQKRGFESDHLHCSLVAEHLRYETCQQIKNLAKAKTLEEKSVPLKFLLAIRDQAPEICHDSRVRRRILEGTSGAAAFAPAEQKLIREISDLRVRSPANLTNAAADQAKSTGGPPYPREGRSRLETQLKAELVPA